jgi:hypothetical protein
MITLANGATTLTLPADLLWSDEFEWRPVAQATDYTLTGALIVQAAARTAGRPITLRSGENYAVLTRQQLDTLSAWADVPGQQMTLSIRGTSRTVMFAHQDAPVITAEMLLYHAAPQAGDLYRCTIKLIET